MKKIIIIALLAQCCLKIQAQEIIKPKLKINHTIGVNTAPIMKRILKIMPDTVKNLPVFMYKLQLGKNSIRLSGVGNRSNEVENVPGFLDSKTKLDYNFALRLGYERQQTIGEQFIVSYGADLTWEYQKNALITDSGFDVVSIYKTQYGYGGGPFLGLTWMLNKRLSIYTEAGVHYIQGRKANITDFIKNPDFNDIKNAADFDRINYFLPTGLFLQYHF